MPNAIGIHARREWIRRSRNPLSQLPPAALVRQPDREEAVREALPAGTAIVRTAQPLGRLAFYLLDPRSDDGLVAWNVLDDVLETSDRYPILRSSVLPPENAYREPESSDSSSGVSSIR